MNTGTQSTPAGGHSAWSVFRAAYWLLGIIMVVAIGLLAIGWPGASGHTDRRILEIVLYASFLAIVPMSVIVDRRAGRPLNTKRRAAYAVMALAAMLLLVAALFRLDSIGAAMAGVVVIAGGWAISRIGARTRGPGAE